MLIKLARLARMTRFDGARLYAKIVKTFRSDESPRLLHEVVAESAFALGLAADFDDALELADPLLSDIRKRVIESQAEAERQGVAWIFELYGSEDEYLRGASTADPTLGESERQTRARRAHVPLIRAELARLAPLDFETACARILQLMGCASPRTSSPGNDGGIDFYGRLELEGRLDNVSPYGSIDRRVGVWLIGQAKNYPIRKIQTAHVRELVGSVELARTGGAIHKWPGLSIRPFDAVTQLFFTTGDFTTGATRLFENSGLVAMNGEQLATFLADANIGIEGDGLVFSSKKLRDELLA